MHVKILMEIAKRAGQMLWNQTKKKADGNMLFNIVVIGIGLFLIFLVLVAGVVMAIFKYFMCSGIMGLFNDCEDDPIPNKDIEKLADLMYEQRKNAGVTTGVGLFRLADESLIGDGTAADMSGEDVDFTQKPYNTNIFSLSSRLQGVVKNKADVYQSVGEKYGINPAFIAAVSMLESGNGSSSLAKEHNNVGGITCASGNSLVKSCYTSSSGRKWSEYSSVDKSIEHMGQIFKKKCADAGKNTVYECWQVYSPPSDGNLTWGPDVVSIMKKMTTDNSMYKPVDESSGSEEEASEETGIAKEAIDEAEIWVRTLAQIDLMKMESSEIKSKNFKEGGKYYNTNLHKTYQIAKEKYGKKDDWNEEIYYYMMQVRFDIYTCYFIEDDKWIGDRCKGAEIEKHIDKGDKGVVPMTVKKKVGEEEQVEFKYTKEELLHNFEKYSLASPKEFKKWVDYYLKTMFEGMYGPDMGTATIPSAGWIIPMEDGTYNFSSPFRPPHRPDHNGVDMGTLGVQRVPVYASASGTVISAGRNGGGYGGIITLDHGNGYYSQYSHFWVDDIVVRKGQTVQQGQLLGGAGNDMYGDAWHLHFEICKSTRTITGSNLAPGKGDLTACADFMDPASPEFGLNFNKVQDTKKSQERATKFVKEWEAKAMKGEIIIMPGFTPSAGLGNLSAKYENRGDPGSCSSGIGDPGGVSCGKYQIATNPGTLAHFVSWLKSKYPKYHDGLKGPTVGSPSFVAAWKKVYQKDPNGFAHAQHQFIIDTHYLPQVNGIKSVIGLDVTQRHFAVQEMVWSMSVQHRNNTPGAFKDALGVNGWKKMSDAEIITKVYDYRYARWSCCRPRFIDEKADALKLLGNAGSSAPNPNVSH